MMRTTHRSYMEEAGDFTRLSRLIVGAREHGRRHSTWCIGRLVDWKYGLYDSKLSMPGFCAQNAQLWFDAFGDLAGVALSESGDAGFTILTAPGFRFLFGPILGWVLEAWAARGPRFSTEITEHQELEMRVLERYGFRRGAAFAARRFDLALPLAAPALEPGFAIVDMHSHPDYRAQAALRADAFQGQQLSDEQLRQRLQLYNYGHGGPLYYPECDLCVLAPDGQLVAGCEALIDPWNAEADVERICTKSAFRNRGFARAVIVACLGRLRNLGMRNAFITGYSDAALALYGSLGHADEKQCWIYETAEPEEPAIARPSG